MALTSALAAVMDSQYSQEETLPVPASADAVATSSAEVMVVAIPLSTSDAVTRQAISESLDSMMREDEIEQQTKNLNSKERAKKIQELDEAEKTLVDIVGFLDRVKKV